MPVESIPRRWEVEQGAQRRRNKLTRRHVKGRTTTGIIASGILGGESEVCYLHCTTLVRDKNVLRFQVPVVNSSPMAVLDGVQDLEEDMLDQEVIPNIQSQVRDVVEKVALGAVLQDNIDTVRLVHDPVHGHDVGMPLNFPVCSDLPGLIRNGPAVLWLSIRGDPVQTFNGTAVVCFLVESLVHNAIGARSQWFPKVETVSDPLSTSLKFGIGDRLQGR